MKTLLYTALSFTICLLAPRAHAWSEQGHHLIAVIAFDQLSPAEQAELQSLLTHHPRYEQDFRVPDGVADADRFRAGRAGYWPDVARQQPEYNRPEWHYQLGASVIIGDPASVNVPAESGRLPPESTLDSRELHTGQAITLCRRVLGDPAAAPADRALALCWLGHLVADSHQPCHAGTMYAEKVFPEGDRRANEVRTRQGSNMHALWDGLLGGRYSENAIEGRRAALMDSDALHAVREQAKPMADDPPSTWLAESRELAQTAVYTAEVTRPIEAVIEGKAERLPQLNMSREYMQTADECAKTRAIQSGYRLAAIWRQGLSAGAP